MDVENFRFPFVYHVLLVFWVDLTEKVDGPSSAAEAHELFHFGVEISSGAICCCDVPVFVCVDEYGHKESVVGYDWILRWSRRGQCMHRS